MKIRHLNKISCNDCPTKQFCLTKNLNNQEIKMFNQLITYAKVFQPGQHIYLAGDNTTDLYAIYDGICKDYYLDKYGNEYINQFYYPGDIMGLEFLNTSLQKNGTLAFPKRSSLYAVAIKKTTICVIPEEKFIAFFRENQKFQNTVINLLVQKIVHFSQNQLSINAKQKVAAIYLELIKKHQQFQPSSKEIPIEITQIDMSNKLRLANETFSRALHALMKEKVLLVKNHTVRYADIKALEKLAFSKF